MKRGHIAVAALTAGLLMSVLGGTAGASNTTITPTAQPTGGYRDPAFTFAVIGDIPYGATQIAEFPERIAQINADRQVQLVDHLGDIKNGSSTCDDAYFAKIKSDFDTFRDPLVYAAPPPTSS